jgi:hypothetical protein
VRADEYQRAAKNLRDFLPAFDQLMLDLEPTFGDGSFSRWKPKPDRRSQADRLASELARLAGPAAEAFDASGVWTDYTPPGTWQTQLFTLAPRVREAAGLPARSAAPPLCATRRLGDEAVRGRCPLMLRIG